MKKAGIYGVISLIAFSCSNGSSTGDNNSIVNVDSGISSMPTPNEQIGNHIKLSFAKDSNSLTTTAHLDSALGTVICFLEVKQGRHLTASLEPATKTANIRFNQINLPNGTSDGPFGKTLDYTLKGPGLYKLQIGSSMMAESPYTGKFILKVKVE